MNNSIWILYTVYFLGTLAMVSHAILLFFNLKLSKEDIIIFKIKYKWLYSFAKFIGIALYSFIGLLMFYYSK